MRLRSCLLAATALVAAGFVVPAPARAEPISAAIAAVAAAGSIGGAAIGAGTVGALLIDTAIAVGVSYGLSALSQALQPKPSAGQALSGLETQVQIGGDVARQIAVGTTLLKGQLVFHNTNGGNNEFYQRVFVLSDWRHETLNAIYMNGQRYTLTEVGRTDTHVAYTVDGTNHYVNLDFWFGRQGPGQADELLVQSANPAGKWDANSTLTGLCYVAMQFTYYKDAPYYQNGIPDLAFELGPACLYDWRQDTTAGGSGDHRWDDTLTWRPSENPFVGLYNYLRGFHLGGERILGMGVPSYDFILETWTAAANVCDESVTKDDGSTEPRYRCSVVLSADEDVTHAKTIDALLATCAGYLYDYGGSYFAQAGAAQYPVDPITDDDLVIGSPVSFAAKRSRAELVNTIHGQYLDVASGWQPQSYTAQVSDGGVVNDGEVLGKPLDLLNVASKSQAERIARARLRESRAQASAGLTVGFHRLDLQVGDWLPWNSNRFGARTWRIVNKQVNATTLAVTLELAEINAAVYSWTAADETPLPAEPIRLQPGGRISTVSGFGAQAVGVRNEAGTTEIPGLRFFWNPIADDTVDAVVIEYRQLASGATLYPTTRVTDSTPDDGELLVTSGIVNATDYEYRATIRTTPSRFTTWTPWTSMRTTDDFSIATTIDDLVGELKTRIDAIPGLDSQLAELDGQVAALDGQVEAVDDKADAIRNAADGIHAALSDDPNLRSTVAIPDLQSVRTDLDNVARALAANRAEFLKLQAGLVEAGFQVSSTEGRARISAVAAVNNQLTALSITVDALSGKIDLYGSVQTGDLSGLVNQITLVQQTLNAVSGTITALASQEIVSGINTRLSAAETILDGPNGLAATAVRQTTFDGLALRTTNVESTLEAIAGIADYSLDLSSIAAASDNVDSLTGAVAQLLGQILTGNATAVEQLATVRDAYSANTRVVREALATVSRDLVAANTFAVAGLSRLDLVKVTAEDATALARLQVQARFGSFTTNLDQILTTYATQADAGAIAQTQIGAALQPGGSISVTLSNTLSGYVTPASAQGIADTRISAQLGPGGAIAGVLAGYVTGATLSQTLSGYVTPTSAQGIADTRIGAQLGQGGSIAAALSNYITSTSLSNTLSGYVTPSSATGIAQTEISASLNPGGAIANVLGSYVTGATLSQSLAGYVTPSDANAIADTRIHVSIVPGGEIRNYVDGTFTTDATVSQRLQGYVTTDSAAGIIDSRIGAQLGGGGSIISTISSQLAAFDNYLNSSAGYILDLRAKYNAISASGQINLVSSSGPAGASSAFEIALAAGNIGTGFKMLAMSDGTSQIELSATRTRFTDPAFGSRALFAINAGAAEFNVPVRVLGKDVGQNAITTWQTFAFGQLGLANANQVLAGSSLSLGVDYPGFIDMDVAFDVSATGAFYAYAEVDDGSLFSWPIVTMNTTPSNSDSNRRWVQGRISLEVGGGNHTYRVRVACNNATLWNTRGSVKITKR